MVEQIILVQEEYDKLVRFMRSGIGKDEKAKYCVITDISYIPMTIMKMRTKADADGEEFVLTTILYCNTVYRHRDTNYDDKYLTFNLECGKDTAGFEFIPVKSKEAYHKAKAYDMIKMGFVNLQGITQKKEEADVIYQMLKDLESDDTEDTSS